MTDHPAYLGLLADILEHPDDDTPRLVLADWLEDHGDPERGEFIRDEVWWRGDRFLMFWREGATVHVSDATLRDRVAGVYPTLPVDLAWDSTPPGTLVYLFRRGFVEEASCSAKWWRRHGPELVAGQPITRVSASDVSIVFQDEGRWWIRGFRLNLPLGPEEFTKAFGPFDSSADAHAGLSEVMLAWAVAEAKSRGLWPQCVSPPA